MTLEELETEKSMTSNIKLVECVPCRQPLNFKRVSPDNHLGVVEPDIQVRTNFDGTERYMVLSEDGRWVPVEDYYMGG